MRFEFLLAFRSYLMSIESSQVAAIITYLGGQSPSKWRVPLVKSITQAFSFLHLFFHFYSIVYSLYHDPVWFSLFPFGNSIWFLFLVL